MTHGTNTVATELAHSTQPNLHINSIVILGRQIHVFPFSRGSLLPFRDVNCVYLLFVTCLRVEHIDQVPDMLDYRIRMCST